MMTKLDSCSCSPDDLSHPIRSIRLEPGPALASSKVSLGKPLVSILIPAFNAQQFIADTLRSVVAQTWDPKEIIVVDDGSSDQTLAIARRFESDNVNVRDVNQNNQGAAAARNTALSLSRGDYVQWLDADDLLAPDKISRQMAALDQCRNSRTLLCSAFGKFMYRDYRATFRPTALWCDLSPAEWLLRKMEGQNVYMQTACWLVSRELAEAAGPWDARLSSDDDGEYFCRVLLASHGTRFVPESTVYYRAPMPQSLSRIGRSQRKIDALWVSMLLHMSYLRSLEDSPRARAACVTYLHNNLICFYPEQHQILRQVEQIAKDLGGELHAPVMSWKYNWIVNTFGWTLAKYLQVQVPKIRWSMQRFWDKSVYHLKIDFRRSHSGA